MSLFYRLKRVPVVVTATSLRSSGFQHFQFFKQQTFQSSNTISLSVFSRMSTQKDKKKNETEIVTSSPDNQSSESKIKKDSNEKKKAKIKKNETKPNESDKGTKSRKRSLKVMQEEDEDKICRSTKKRKLNIDETKQSEDDDTSPCTETFKICCYNLNGVRAAAKKGLEEYIEQEDADIVCFSEMKAKQVQNPCTFRGYELIWCECTDKAGYAGSAVLSKVKPLNVIRGIGSKVDGEGRALTVEYDKFYLVNCYVPNSGQNLKFKERRLEWDEAMKKWLTELQEKKPVIWTGDLNVAILDFDVYDGETNKSRSKTAGFTPYERNNFKMLSKELGLVDAYRHFYPTEREKHFTFFSTRGKGMKDQNKGWRLDYFMVSKQMVNILEDVQVKKEKAYSDHVPLVLTMKHPDIALS